MADIAKAPAMTTATEIQGDDKKFKFEFEIIR